MSTLSISNVDHESTQHKKPCFRYSEQDFDRVNNVSSKARASRIFWARKRPQPVEDLTQGVTGAAPEGIRRGANGSFEEISRRTSIGLEMSDGSAQWR